MTHDMWDYPPGVWGSLAEVDHRRAKIRRDLAGRVRRPVAARRTGWFAWLRLSPTRRAVAADLPC